MLEIGPSDGVMIAPKFDADLDVRNDRFGSAADFGGSHAERPLSSGMCCKTPEIGDLEPNQLELPNR